MENQLNSFNDEERKARLRHAIDRYLDSGRGSCVLNKAIAAQVVIDAWRHFDGQRYRLHAWVVMPNHVHVLVELLHGHRLPDIVRSWKTFTARMINRHLGRSGALWMPDYWDRFVRDEDHYRRVVNYIRQNPVKAGLVDRAEQWRWSSTIGN